ncbi:MAG: cobaltochelatase subunit CobN [Bryobacterales bacterium]|nr:cobaltochelatase subunit CobN [Bryobacterales bacterium]
MRSLFLAALISIASAAEPSSRMCFLGVWERAEPMLDSSSRELGLAASFIKPAEVSGGSRKAEAESCRILFVLNIEPAEAQRVAKWAAELQGAKRGPRIVALDKRSSHAELERLSVLETDPAIQKYWRANGSVNIGRMLVYAASKYLGRPGKVEPPVEVPDQGLYDHSRVEPFADFASLKTYKLGKGRWKEGAPVAAMLIQQSFWVTRDLKVIDAQVKALEKQGINAAVIFGERQTLVDGLIRQVHPDLLIEDRHGAMWDSRNTLELLDVPYLRPVSMLGYTLDEWRKDPRGLSFRDVGMFMTLQESWGTIEPVVVGGMKVNISGFHLHEPDQAGVTRFAQRAASWIRLRQKPNSEKKIALIYYNKGLGQDDLMRGSPTGAFLDGPESAVRFLPLMKEHGYTLTRLPRDSADLINWIRTGARNHGPWNQGALEQMVERGDPVLIPLRKYRQWFESRLTPAQQALMVKHFGPPPGRIMVVEKDGVKFIVLPRINLGNVVMMPQPERGEKVDEKLLHSRDIPPPHNYLAFYWWLQDGFKADAIVHWGTHGSLELLPGKEAGMTPEDWSSLCTGAMPVVNVWIMDNLAEATLSRRRSFAELVDHAIPPTINSGFPESYANLRSDIQKFNALEPGLLREQFRKTITAAARAEKMLESTRIPPQTPALDDEQVAAISEHIQHLYEDRTPQTLHVLGQPLEEKFINPYLTLILGGKFLDHLAAATPPPAELKTASDKRIWLREQGEAFLAAHLPANAPQPKTTDLVKDLEFAREMRSKLLDARQETAGLLRALDGRFIPPGPGPEPIRNPNSIPGGRNLYALNPEEIPTKAAWEVAVQLIDETLRKRHPHKVGLDLSGMDTMRDFGVIEAQALYLMGVRPVWDRNNLAIDVELIPKEELKRPRVDIFLAMGGLYKENFGTRVKLLDKAVRLVSQLKEDENWVRQGTLDNERRLSAKGFAAEKARELAVARIFGTKPGNMSGTNILYMVPRSGVWEKDDEVASVYIDNMSYVYTGDKWGEKIDGLYEQNIQGTDTLIRVWASNMTSQLSNHHAYEYLGGLSLAVKKLTGKEPEALIADVRDPGGAQMRDFHEVLASNLRSELLNKNWVAGMKEHGYAGAGHAAELVKNTFGWAVTRSSSVDESVWDEIYSVYVRDKYNLGVRAWMEKDNAHALEEIAATMLEASRKGYWKASGEAVASLSRLYAELVAAHGDSGGLVSGGNKSLEKYVTGNLNAPGSGATGTALAARMSAIIRRAGATPFRAKIDPPGTAPRPGAPPAQAITGTRLALARPALSAMQAVETSPILVWSTALISSMLILYGYRRRKGLLC